MYVITVMNQKGGVGKTTIAQCIAAVGFSENNRVAVIDMDAQGSSHEIHVEEVVDRFDKKNFLSLRFNGADQTLDTYRDLCNGLADLEFDYLILDLPPQLMSREHVVATISDLTIVPMKPSVIDERSTVPAVKILEEVGVNAIVLLNDVPTAKKSKAYRVYQDVKKRLSEHPSVYLAPIELTHRDEYILVGEGQFPVLDYPKTAAAKESRRLFELIKVTLENLPKHAEAA